MNKIKVRKLRWIGGTVTNFFANAFEEAYYAVHPSRGSNAWKLVLFWGEHEEVIRPKTTDVGVSSHPFKTESEAKQAAQEHWEQMIRGCLE